MPDNTTRLIELPVPTLERIFEMLEDLTSANRTTLEGFGEAMRLLQLTEEGKGFGPQIEHLTTSLSNVRSDHMQMQLSVGALVAEGRRIIAASKG